MKKMTKRMIAFVCTLVLMAGGTLGAIGFAAEKDVAIQHKEWSVYSGKAKTFVENGSGGMEVVVQNAGVNLPENVRKADLGLKVTLTVPDTKALASISQGVVELAQDTCDVQELNWLLSGYKLKVGENTIVLPLAQAGTIDGEPFYLHKTINYFRIYSIENANKSMAKLNSVKVVYVREPGLAFGEDKTKDTYLELSKPLNKAPQSIEASILMASDGAQEEEKTEWIIQPGFEVDATSGEVKSFGTNTSGTYSINVSKYTMSDLAIVFRVYAEKAGVLGTGDNFRLGSKKVMGEAFIHYDYNKIPVEAGWNDIELPLDQMTNINNGFTLEQINCFGFTAYNLGAGDKRIFEDIKLKVITAGTEEGRWVLRPGSDGKTSSGHTLGSGTTKDGDAPGADVKYSILDATAGAITGFGTYNGGHEIDASAYAKSELAIAFWVYANADGVLGQGDNMRLSSANALGQAFLYYDYNKIDVKAGWNYITLPLDDWKDLNNGFTLEKVNAFGFTSYKLESGNVRYFGAVELIVLEPETSWMLRPGSSTVSDSGHTLGSYTTVEGDEPGAGKKFFVLDATQSGITGFGTLNNGFAYKFSDYEMSDLAVAFWVYAEKDGTFGKGDNFRLGSQNYKGEKFIHYNYEDIPVKAGWNYIELPLDKWKNTQVGFTLDKVSCFGFTSYNLSAGDKRYIGDIKIVLLENEKEEEEEIIPAVQVTVTENVTKVEENDMIFSNANNNKEENVYALFITKDGYPALLYGTTQYTLTKSVRTGKWVDIAVVKDADGYVAFYLDGVLAAKSSKKAGKLGAPTTKHSIGADGVGKQVMNGKIADIRVWEDERTDSEIAKNLVEKTAGVTANGLNAKTKGLLGNWFLLGDIQYVLETMPDVSANNNTAIYKGSRADDWIDYEIPKEIGKNYWSVVFIPDIQNLVRNDEYNLTWLADAQWIADNIEKENIQHVISAGDSTWSDTDLEYNRAVQGYSKFSNLIPTNILVGNHDYDWDKNYRDAAMYQKYLGESTLLQSATANTYVDSYKDPAGKSTTENSYYRFSVAGKKWMILQLEFHPRASVMEWAQGILKKYQDDNVIVATHSYLDDNGGYADNAYMTYTGNDANDGGSIGSNTQAIWNVYLKEFNNVKMILCGHSHNGTGSVVTRVETNSKGDEVPVLMINAQDMDAWDGTNTEYAYYSEQPLGLLGILRFSEDGSRVAMQYYAPTYGKSFNPTDPSGKADSNNLKYTFSVESCSHKNTTILVNDDKVTGTTSGYTGDTYCTDCDTVISNGTVTKPTGKKPSGQKVDDKNDKNDKNDKDKGKTEQDGDATDAQTGDVMQPVVWIVILCMAAMVTIYMFIRNRKEEK